VKLACLVATALLLAPAAAFAQDAGLPPLAAAAAPKAIAFTEIAQSALGGLPAEGWTILDNDDNFGGWLAMRGLTTMPAYDPSTELAVGITLGTKTTGGYSVDVSKVELVSGASPVVRVSYVETIPQPGQMTNKMVTSPWCVVKFPRQPGLAYNQIAVQKVYPPASKIPFTVIAEATDGGPPSATRSILDNDGNYGMFFAMQGAGPPASPAYDYRTELAVAIAMGSKPTAGYSVKVTSVDLVAAVGTSAQPYIAVSYVETVAGDGAAAGVTAPYTVIKFPRQDGIPYGAVSFRDLSPSGQNRVDRQVSGKVLAVNGKVIIEDGSTFPPGEFYVEKGPLSATLAGLDGKVVQVQGSALGSSLRVTSLTATNTGTGTVAITGASGNALRDIGPGQTATIVGVTPDGSSYIALGLTSAGTVPVSSLSAEKPAAPATTAAPPPASTGIIVKLNP
jgi:hypothetical protein